MSRRIITDSRGDRWDALQPPPDESGHTKPQDARGDAPSAPDDITFRHQSGRQITARAGTRLDSMSDRELLELLDRECESQGFERVGQGREDRSSDADGYTTR